MNALQDRVNRIAWKADDEEAEGSNAELAAQFNGFDDACLLDRLPTGLGLNLHVRALDAEIDALAAGCRHGTERGLAQTIDSSFASPSNRPASTTDLIANGHDAILS